MKYIHKICGKVSLLCYILMLFLLWHLCQYGGMRKHLPMLIVCSVIGGAALISWLIAKWHLRKDAMKTSRKPKIFYMEVLILVIATVSFCGGVAYSAMPEHGALSRKIEAYDDKRQVKLKHNNIFEDGIEGILTDLDKKLDLPEELYISQSFRVTFDATGTIQHIDTFLYGKTETDYTKTYLVEYDADKSSRMTVWLDGYTKDSYEEDMCLRPMLHILERAPWKEKVGVWSEMDMDQEYEIFYAGRRTFAVKDGLYRIPGDIDGDGIDSGMDYIPWLQSGGNIVAYEVSLHVPESESTIPVRYIMEPAYTTQEEINAEHTTQQVEQAKDSPSWSVDQSDGSMYFFLDDSNGWRLTVADAAAGSRLYCMEKTEDGGASWTVCSEDPFQGNAGVAEGLIFFDENLGVAGLAGASQTTSALYLTTDGGVTFQEITLPMDQVTQLPETAEEYGFTVEDYDYLNMPEMREDVLMLTVTSAAEEDDGIVFYSADAGATWSYEGISE